MSVVVVSLESDNEFISQWFGENIAVLTYNGDVNDVKMFQETPCSSDHWRTCGVVYTTANRCTAIQVFGNTIDGEKLQALCGELKAMEKRRGSTVFVNRLGLCLMSGSDEETVTWINDRFCWSKYGVELPQAGVQASVGSDAVEANNEELRRSLEEKNVELAECKKELEEKGLELNACKKELMEANNEELRRSLEEKNVELVACKKELEEKSVELAVCKKELEWSKKMEKLMNQLVEEKEKVNEMMKNQLHH